VLLVDEVVKALQVYGPLEHEVHNPTRPELRLKPDMFYLGMPYYSECYASYSRQQLTPSQIQV
jgi:hypothetical protein